MQKNVVVYEKRKKKKDKHEHGKLTAETMRF